MKKTIWITLVLLLMCVFVLSACDSGDTPPNKDVTNQTESNNGGGNNEVDDHTTTCQHTSSDWIIDKSATCKEAGSKHKECTKCEEILEAGSVDKLTTHTPGEAVTENYVDSNCTTDGSYNLVTYCSVCNEKLSTEAKIVEKRPHTSSEWIIDKDATCKEVGTKHRECTKCEEVLETASIDKLTTHTPGESVTENYVDSDCTTEGSYNLVVYCSVCNEKLSAEAKIVEKKPHTEVIDEAVRATCTKTGLTEGKHCSACEMVLVKQQVTPISHNWTTKFEYNTNSHWLKCTMCEATNQNASHDIGADGYCKICDNPIRETEGVVYLLSADGTYAEVIDYTGNSLRVIIAPVYNGVPVTHIGSEAFSNKLINSIVIPDSVTSIGSYAFSSCRNLKDITLSKKIKNIDYSAFYYCENLENVFISDIAAWCSISFYEVTSSPLYYAKNLYLNGELLTEAIIPEGVTIIGSYAFRNCTSLISITLPNSITSIGDSAFSNCTNLTSITIPKNVTSIGSEAFYNCTGLTGVYISDLVQWCTLSFENFEANPLAYAKKLYLNGSPVTELVIPNSITKISQYAFINCTSFISIIVPESVTSIGYGAFGGCVSLESMVIPFVGASPTETKISKSSLFGYIFGNMSICGGVTTKQWFDTSSSLGYVYYRIPASLKSVTVTSGQMYDYAFNECNYLTTVIIGDGITSIGCAAFYRCSSLTHITIPNSVKSIGDSAFRYCSSLLNITLPDGITTIAGYTFSGCSSLTGIVIPDSVTSIVGYSLPSHLIEKINGVSYVGTIVIDFDNSTAVVEIRDGTTMIANDAFEYASKVRSITIPNTVKTICSRAFSGCNNLTSIIVPDSVINIGSYAFNGCSSLTNINYCGTKEQWQAITKGSSWNSSTGDYTITYNYTGE